jgi:hypothetical protein
MAPGRRAIGVEQVLRAGVGPHQVPERDSGPPGDRLVRQGTVRERCASGDGDDLSAAGLPSRPHLLEAAGI